MNNDWGVPEWKNADDYPQASTPNVVWPWEFLRRNHAYRNFWKTRILPFTTNGVIYKDAAGTIWPYLEELQNTFGVDVPASPCSGTSTPFFVAQWTRFFRYDERLQTFGLNPNQLAFIIDLSRPLKEQIDGVRKTAQREQNALISRDEIKFKAARARAEKYPDYLRILDAKDAGATLDEIAEVLRPLASNSYADGHPARKSIADDFRAAKALRDGGYLALIS